MSVLKRKQEYGKVIPIVPSVRIETVFDSPNFDRGLDVVVSAGMVFGVVYAAWRADTLGLVVAMATAGAWLIRLLRRI